MLQGTDILFLEEDQIYYFLYFLHVLGAKQRVEGNKITFAGGYGTRKGRSLCDWDWGEILSAPIMNISCATKCTTELGQADIFTPRHKRHE